MKEDRFCILLAESWSFNAHRLAETMDGMYVDEPQELVNPDILDLVDS